MNWFIKASNSTEIELDRDTYLAKDSYGVLVLIHDNMPNSDSIRITFLNGMSKGKSNLIDRIEFENTKPYRRLNAGRRVILIQN